MRGTLKFPKIGASRRKCWMVLALLCWPAPGFAQERTTLSLGDYLQAVLATHPKLAAARAKGRAAKAKLREAQGAYDPKLSLRGQGRPVGQYRYGVAAAKVSQLTPFWGASAFAEYGLGWGKFPVYDGEKKTGSLGRFKAGVALPVLAGGRIDEARAQRRRRAFELGGQTCEIDQVRLDLLSGAAQAYWEWVLRASEVKIRQELLAVAQERDRALQRRLETGAIAAIVALDNQRLILGRESKLIEAQRKLEQTSIKMSLYWRDEQGHPVVAQASQVPPALTLSSPNPKGGGVLTLDALSQAKVEETVLAMPAMCKVQARMSDAKVAVALRRNQRLPQLDVQGYVAQYLGDNSPTPPTDLGVALQFSLALGMRKVTGKWRAAQAKLEALTQERRQLLDQMMADVARARVDVHAAAKQLEIADRKVRLSTQMAQAERTKFEQGASDLVLVNLRELALADAQRDRVEVWADFQRAQVHYYRSLGLDPMGRSVRLESANS